MLCGQRQCLLQVTELRKEEDKTLPYVAANQAYSGPRHYILLKHDPGSGT